MSIEPATNPARVNPIAAVRARLAPIRSRKALIESYRTEQRGRLAGIRPTSGSPAEMLDLAYAMRWWELGRKSARASRRAARTE